MTAGQDRDDELRALERRLEAARSAFDLQHQAHLDELRDLAEELAQSRRRADDVVARGEESVRRVAELESGLAKESARADAAERRLERLEGSRAYRVGSRISSLTRPIRRILPRSGS